MSDNNQEVISAFSFNTGKMIEQVIKDQTDNLELTNRNLQALILNYRHCIEDPIQRQYYEKYFNIQTVEIESENKTMETVKETKRLTFDSTSGEVVYKDGPPVAPTIDSIFEKYYTKEPRSVAQLRGFMKEAMEEYASIQTSELKAENERLKDAVGKIYLTTAETPELFVKKVIEIAESALHP